ncbi:hypothetical protein Ctob_001837 [Chrysochromulina tobinii]|uniref:Uncharacterized protein n=1 Tax=Chrysochromulina tobinii TaxID=1460289 RepID=A0A0M0J482_9EUKA|nr:hypothetical protein Ctob_001837 [Chrysochromulina tobinii]|eukprot:KOO21142.1 hypothetical protein Ctob_001837 [Chrysochromulina sp. CCMP291]
MFATLSAASTQGPGVQMLLSELPSVLRALAAGLAAAPKSCLICLRLLLSADRAAMHAHAELWLPGVVEFVLDELKEARLADAEAARLAAAEATGKKGPAVSSSEAKDKSKEAGEAKDKSKEADEAKENQGGAGSSGRRSPVWEVIARTPPGLPEPILLPTPTTNAAREEATARLWGAVAELLGPYLGEPDRRDQLNQFLTLPAAPERGYLERRAHR